MRLPLFFACVLATFFSLHGETTPRVEPTGDISQWLVEQLPGGTVTTRDAKLVIEDTNGVTVWFKQKLQAPLIISYDVAVIDQGGPHDRVSDVNCFWMANDPLSSDGCPFAVGHGRSGKLEDYDSMQTYYVGMGGNYNSTTRFRRYEGNGIKPLLPENDLHDKKFLLSSNQTYHIRLIVRDGTTEYWRNGERLFSFKDPKPLTTGWFAFRTVKSHLEFSHFRIEKLPVK